MRDPIEAVDRYLVLTISKLSGDPSGAVYAVVVTAPDPQRAINEALDYWGDADHTPVAIARTTAMNGEMLRFGALQTLTPSKEWKIGAVASWIGVK